MTWKNLLVKMGLNLRLRLFSDQVIVTAILARLLHHSV
jgi:hypothetical protein